MTTAYAIMNSFLQGAGPGFLFFKENSAQQSKKAAQRILKAPASAM